MPPILLLHDRLAERCSRWKTKGWRTGREQGCIKLPTPLLHPLEELDAPLGRALKKSLLLARAIDHL
jgi:hypothetical protein